METETGEASTVVETTRVRAFSVTFWGLGFESTVLSSLDVPVKLVGKDFAGMHLFVFKTFFFFVKTFRTKKLILSKIS